MINKEDVDLDIIGLNSTFTKREMTSHLEIYEK